MCRLICETDYEYNNKTKNTFTLHTIPLDESKMKNDRILSTKVSHFKHKTASKTTKNEQIN